MNRASLDGHALAARYEALRQEIVDPEGCRHAAHGLVLLVRRGMAAWMKEIGDAGMHRAATPTTVAATHMPDGIERSLIDIVAAMALGARMEGRP
jgi:hypothetical protein